MLKKWFTEHLKSVSVWLHAAVSAAVGGAATSLGAHFVDPEHITFDQAGIAKMKYIALAGAVPAVLAVFKQSPLPPNQVK
jgi:hypothetical protein